MIQANDQIPLKDREELGVLVWKVFESWAAVFNDPQWELLHRAFEWFEVEHEHFPALAHFLADAIHPKRIPRVNCHIILDTNYYTPLTIFPALI